MRMVSSQVHDCFDSMQNPRSNWKEKTRDTLKANNWWLIIQKKIFWKEHKYFWKLIHYRHWPDWYWNITVHDARAQLADTVPSLFPIRTEQPKQRRETQLVNDTLAAKLDQNGTAITLFSIIFLKWTAFPSITQLLPRVTWETNQNLPGLYRTKMGSPKFQSKLLNIDLRG